MSQPTERVLLVDDDPDLLEALCRHHRKHFDLEPACGPDAALEKLSSSGPFALVVSDYQMPGMDGVRLLGKVKQMVPETVRVMLTGQADLQTAIDAVNEGAIFRFLTKPCAPETFRSCVEAALEQHRLRHAERILLEHTVRGSIEVLSDVLALANPPAFGRATRVRDYVRHVVSDLHLPNPWQYETAALLSQIGYVAVPDDLLDKVASGHPLDHDQRSTLERHPQVARDLLRRIPRLQPVAEIIYRQHGTGVPPGEDPAGPEVVLGGRILAAALEFEELVSLGASPRQALQAMQKKRPGHDPRILEALGSMRSPAQGTAVRLLPLSKILVGMVLDEDVRNVDQALIVPRGHAITLSSLERLRNYAKLKLLAKTELRLRMGPAQGSSTTLAA